MDPTTNSFIIQNSCFEKSDYYLLKLNRTTHQLEVYAKSINENPGTYYSLRENFDTSDYSLFELEKTFDCIIGGKNTPTPAGLFAITNKSSGEYISTYYSKKSKVKFFGYLVIFEDYFIHSNLYDVDAELPNHVDSISLDDENTSGCIRVSQDDLKWLMENIEIGTTIIM